MLTIDRNLIKHVYGGQSLCFLIIIADDKEAVEIAPWISWLNFIIEKKIITITSINDHVK